MEECPHMSMRNWTISVEMTLDSLKRITIWVEIKQKKSKNTLCCCAYRHPDTVVDEFKDHLEKVFQTISKENKLIYLMGDFNFDLLNYETDTGTAGFFNSIVQFDFLHLIHQPPLIDQPPLLTTFLLTILNMSPQVVIIF